MEMQTLASERPAQFIVFLRDEKNAGLEGRHFHLTSPCPKSIRLRDAARRRRASAQDQLSDSTNTSSRFLRSDGSTASTSRKAAIAINTADSGRVRKTDQSPREISNARRRFSSISGPSTIPSSNGAGSKSCLINQ